MKIAFNPLGSGALIKAPDNKDITFDLVGRVIYARGVSFDGKNTLYKTFKKHTSSDNTGGSEGLVPIPSYSTTNTRLLREDGLWVNIAGAAPPDTELSTESTNAVQNKVITNKINEILASMQLKAADVYRNIKVGTTTLVASGVNDTLEFKLGNGITITPNATNKTLEFSINATGNLGISTSYSNKQLIVKILDEYYNKWNAVYDWYISVTEEDTDDLINKWQEIVDFLNSVAEGTDILDEFVTRKTAQTITGVKTFNTQLKFTVADGTSPFTVTSKTLVTNLNADLLDGTHKSGLLTALANVNTTDNPLSIYITVGGTTKYLKVSYSQHSTDLVNTSVTNPDSAVSGQYLKWYSQINRSGSDPYYAGTNTGFPVGNNANGILWLGTHSGPYGGLLGVSSNGRLYYRFITNNTFPTTANGGSWNRIAWSSEVDTLKNYYWADVKISSTSSTTTKPTFATATATISVTTPLVSSTGRLTLNATSTALDLKFNNDNTKSVILNGTEFKPYDDANGKLDLGASDARWKGLYAGTGSFSGNVTIAGTMSSANYLLGTALELKTDDTACQTTVFGSNNSGYRMRIVRQATSSNLNTLYSPTLVLSSLDTHAYIAWRYDSDSVWVGGGSGNKWNWRSRLITSANYGSYLGYIGTTAVLKSSAAQALTGITNATLSGRLIFTTAATTASISFINGELIDGYGNVLLGTNSTSWNVFDSSRSSLITALNSGNVGIGTTSPSYKLHVVGRGYFSGNITIGGNQYVSNSTYGINMLNSDIALINSLYFADLSDSSTEGIHFYRSTTTWDTLNAKNGILYFSGNRATSDTTLTPVFSALANSGNNISITIGGQNRTLTPAYATKAGDADTLDGYHRSDIIKYYGATETSGFDLNNLRSGTAIVVGYWAYAGSANVSNLPWGSSAATTWTLPGSYPMLIARFYNSNDIKVRGYYSSSGWTSWVTLLHSGNYKTQIGDGVYWKVNGQTTVGTGDIYLEMWRGANASWKMLNTSGTLKFLCNYTSAAGSYYDALTVTYNTGNVWTKGSITSATGIHNSSTTLYLDSASTTTSIIFRHGTTERMRIALPNGYVGIGTTAPIHKLQVTGAGVFSNTGSTTYASDGITIGAGDAVARYITCYGKTGLSYINIGYNAAANNSGELHFSYSSSGSTSNYVGLLLYGAANCVRIYPGYTQSIKYILAPNYVSSVATGTLPYACTSATLNTNLNADLLDGYHASSFELIKVGTVKPTGTAVGWYRCAQISSSNAGYSLNIIISLQRSYNSPQNEHYIFAISVGYNGLVSINQISGCIGGLRINKVRVVYNNSGKCYFDYYMLTSNYDNGYKVQILAGDCISYLNPVLVSSAGGTAVEFTTVNGIKSNYGFTGNLTGNASSASKLGSSTVGGTYQPIYLSSGTATAGTSYAKAIKSITRSGTTFTYTCIDGTTGTFTLLDNNTTYYVYGKTINASYKTAYRTLTGRASGYYLAAIRCDTASVAEAPLYGSGIAFGMADTHGYLYMNYSSAYAYIGAGNADKLNWTATLLHSSNSSVSGGGSAGGSSITVKINNTSKTLTIPTSLPANGGTSSYTNYLKIHDVRGTNHLPNSTTYPEKNIAAWFNNTGTPDSSWWSGITVKGWTSTYAVWQLCSYSSTGTANNYRLYHRNGINGGWGSWKTIAYTSDIPSVGNGTVTIKQAGTTKGSFTMNQSGNTTIELTDNNTNTHWTTRIYAGASGTAANAAATNPYLKVTDDNTYRNLVRFVGGGATTVSSDASGNITISSTNTTYSFAAKGSATQGIYLSGTNTFAAMTYSLKATVNAGTAGKLAYYSGANAISAYTSTVGDYSTPVYINGGVPVSCYAKSVGSVTWGTSCSGYIYVYQFGPITILLGYISTINVSNTSSTNYVFKLPSGARSPSTSCGFALVQKDGYSNDRNTVIRLSGQYGYCDANYNDYNPVGASYYFTAAYM